MLGAVRHIGDPAMSTTFEWDVAGIIIMIVIGLAVCTRWMIIRMDREHANLHKRINDVRENYVRRDDMKAQMDHIERMQDKIMNEQSEHARNVSNRFDAILTSITQLAAAVHTNGEKR